MADLKILVLDDELDERTWLTALFEDNGYQTITAEDGEKGLAQAQAGGWTIDTVRVTVSDGNSADSKVIGRIAPPAPGSEHDQDCLLERRVFLDGPAQGFAVHLWHHMIKDHQVKGLAGFNGLMQHAKRLLGA